MSELYTWERPPSAFVDQPVRYVVTREGRGKVAEVSLHLDLPFHAAIVDGLCDVLDGIERSRRLERESAP